MVNGNNSKHTINKLKKIRIFIFSSVLVLNIVILTGCNNNQEQERSGEFNGIREIVSIAVPEPPTNWLTLIAIDHGFFSDNGLDITEKYYPSGKRSLMGMLAGEVDIAPVAKVPVVFNSFSCEDFKLFSVIGSSYNDEKIVARKVAGIQKPVNLKGKRIATQKASSSHFFLHLFLVKNAILDSEVELSFMKIEDLPGALERGEVDAISTREPFLRKSINLLKGDAIVFSAPGLYEKNFVLVAFNQFIMDKPHIIERVLRSLLDAEEFVKKHPDKAIKSLSLRLKLNEDIVAKTLSEVELEIKLRQFLLHGLENMSRWVRKNKMVDSTKIPNYLNFIDSDGLKATKPGVVTIIH